MVVASLVGTLSSRCSLAFSRLSFSISNRTFSFSGCVGVLLIEPSCDKLDNKRGRSLRQVRASGRGDSRPNPCARGRHVEVLDAEGGEGVQHGADDGGEGADRAGFPGALGA